MRPFLFLHEKLCGTSNALMWHPTLVTANTSGSNHAAKTCILCNVVQWRTSSSCCPLNCLESDYCCQLRWTWDSVTLKALR